jgi:hypothetical protein
MWVWDISSFEAANPSARNSLENSQATIRCIWTTTQVPGCYRSQKSSEHKPARLSQATGIPSLYVQRRT